MARPSAGGTPRRWTALTLVLAAMVALAGCTPGVGLPPVETSPSGLNISPVPSDSPSAAASVPADAGSPTPSSSSATIAAGPAPTQSFPVGVRQLDLSRGDRPLRTVVWYPATRSGSAAPVASGVFPLVLFSHGLTATPESYQSLTMRIAAAGFVVAAPAYPYTNGGASSYNPTDLVNQPADGSAVITGVLALNGQPDDLLSGHLDPNRIAATGHSGGAYTTVGMLAGGRDNRLRAAVVIAGGSLGGSFNGPTVSVLFVHGDKDPIVSYGIGRSTYNMVPWPKAFLTVTNGDHTSYLFGSSTASTAVVASILDFLRWSLYGDPSAKSRLSGEAAAGGSTTFETTL